MFFVFGNVYSQTAEEYLERGKYEYYLGRYYNAIPEFNQALSIDPNNIYAYIYRSLAKNNTIGYKLDAHNDLLKAESIDFNLTKNIILDINSNESKLREKSVKDIEAREIANARLRDLAHLKEEEERKEKVKLAEEARIEKERLDSIEKEKTYTEAYNEGSLALKSKNNQLAIEKFKVAIANKPNDAQSYLNLGNAYFNIKNCDEALSSYNKALNIDPKIENIKKNMDLATKMYNSPKEVKKREEATRIAEDRRREQEREQEREYEDRRKKEASIKYNWQCSRCQRIIQVKSPNGFGCQAKGGTANDHHWRNMGEVGDNSYSCSRCGAVIMCKSYPEQMGCLAPGGTANDHHWHKD